jgi:hypothetical protein
VFLQSQCIHPIFVEAHEATGDRVTERAIQPDCRVVAGAYFQMNPVATVTPRRALGGGEQARADAVSAVFGMRHQRIKACRPRTAAVEQHDIAEDTPVPLIDEHVGMSARK